MLPMVKKDDKGLRISIVNDSNIKNVDLEIEIWSFEKGKILERKYENLRILQDAVVQIDTIEVNPNIFSESIVYEKLIYDNESVESHEVLGRLRNTTLSDPKISYKKDGDLLKIKCENMAYGVVIHTENDTVLSNNFFTLVPSKEKLVKNVKGDFEISSAYDYIEKHLKSL